MPRGHETHESDRRGSAPAERGVRTPCSQVWHSGTTLIEGQTTSTTDRGGRPSCGRQERSVPQRAVSSSGLCYRFEIA